jgi:hypothetical protein
MERETDMDMLTDVEFYHLPRHRGRIVDLPMVFIRLTDDQVNMLHGDDWSYYHELQEELSYLMADFV